MSRRSIDKQFGGMDNFDEAKKLLEVMNVVDTYYIGDGNVETMTDAASAAIVKSLGDRWSYYMSPSEYDAYKLYSSNQYAGIGVGIKKTDKGFEISSITADSPAASAGLVIGDVITAVQGESVAEKTADEVRELIRGYLNATVTLTIENGSDSKDVKVDCTVIYSNPVSYELMSGNVGYIRIANFEAGSGKAASDAVDSLLTQGAVGIVFDVRSNPGGLLSELMEILDHILPEGDIFVSVNKAGDETVTKSDNVCIELPMTVLVNADTYSAAEFFAAALSEYDWATTVGEHTSGKARSQITVDLPDGSAVHISSNQYLTPERVDLAAQGGIAPDYTVPMMEEGDAQLEAAIGLLMR